MRMQSAPAHGATRRNDAMLRDVLCAQLKLLQAFIPLTSWLLIREEGGSYDVLASVAAHEATVPGTLGAILAADPGWARSSEYPGFEHRALSPQEKKQLTADLSAPSSITGLLRCTLHPVGERARLWLAATLPSSSPRTQNDAFSRQLHIQNGLSALALTLALHTKLETLGRRLEELQRDAFTEPLTGVLNRAGWANRVEHLEKQVIRSKEDVAIIMLDLDLLKLVNDRQGHSAGDELLQLTAKTISSVLRSEDVVGRLGGDEFGVAVKGLEPSQAAGLVARLRSALNAVDVGVSLGMALRSEAQTLDDTMALADARMYEDKRSKPLLERSLQPLVSDPAGTTTPLPGRAP